MTKNDSKLLFLEHFLVSYSKNNNDPVSVFVCWSACFFVCLFVDLSLRIRAHHRHNGLEKLMCPSCLKCIVVTDCFARPRRYWDAWKASTSAYSIKSRAPFAQTFLSRAIMILSIHGHNLREQLVEIHSFNHNESKIWLLRNDRIVNHQSGSSSLLFLSTIEITISILFTQQS